MSRHTIARTLAATGVFGVLISAIFAFMPAGTAIAGTGINQQINFQGKLVNTDGTNIPDGTYNMEFKIYTGGDGTAAGDTSPAGSPGTLQWTEDHLVNNTQGVSVTAGIFQVSLGAITALPTAIFNTDTIWLSINLGTTNATCTPFSNCGGDGEMLPMIRYTAAPYAFNALQLGGLTASQFGQLQTGTPAAQTGTLDVSGNLIAATSVQAPLVDTATGVALDIGTGTATSVTIGQTTTPFLIQGDSGSSGSKLTATSGSNTTTIGFANPTVSSTLNFVSNAAGTYTICTSEASTCSGTYATSLSGTYLAKNTADTSSAAITAGNYLYGFTNSQATATTGGVLNLSNGANTGDTLYVTASGNPAATTNALVVANNTAATPSGNLLDLQQAGANQLSVDYQGNLTQVGGTATTDTINGQTISAAANFTGTVTAATSVLTPVVDTASAGTLSIGSTNATTINVGTGTGSETVSIGSGSTGSNTDTVTVGSNNSTSVTNINGGTGTNGVNILAGSLGQINVGTSNSNTTEIGGVAGTIGYTSVGTTQDSGANNLIGGGQYTAPSTGTITSVSAYVGSLVQSSPNNEYQIGIYSDNGSNVPNTLIASTAVGTITANAWNTLSISASVTAGTKYWLMYWTNTTSSSDNALVYNNVSGQLHYYAYNNATTFTGTMPATFPAPTSDNNENYFQSMFATYGSASGPAVVVASDGSLTANGSATFKDSTNSTTAFQIQNASGYTLLSADTTGGVVTLGNITTANGQGVAGKLNFADGTNDAFGGTVQLGGALTADATYDLPNLSGTQTICTTNASSCSSIYQAAGNYLVQAPTSTAQNTVSPASGVVGLTVNGTTGATAAQALVVNQSQAADGEDINITNTAGTVANALNITKSGAGTLTNSIAAPNFTLSSAGAVTAVGLNSGTGLIQGTGGETVTGTEQLNASGNGATTIGNTAGTGALSIQGGSGGSTVNDTGGSLTLSTTTSGALSVTSAAAISESATTTLAVSSTNFSVTTGGVVSGSTGYQINGANALAGHYLRGNGTDYVDSTIQSGDIPVCTGSCNYISNQTATQSAANYNIQSAAAGDVGGVIQGASSQTADLFDLRDSSSGNLQSFSAAGNQESLGYYDNGIGGIGQYGNALLFSENLANGGHWTATNVVATAGSNTAPDGNTTGTQLVGTGGSNVVQSETSVVSAGTYTFSVWLKQSSGAATTGLCIYSTGGTPSSCTATAVTPNSTDWQRFSVTQAISGTSTAINAEILPGNGSTATIYAWGAQLVEASVPEVYVRTTGSAVVPSSGVVSNGGQFISADSTTDIPLVVQAQPSATGDLFDLQNSSASVIAGFTASGDLKVTSAVDTEAASGTLALGTTNATTVNIGPSGGGTVNLQTATVTAGTAGSSIFENNGATFDAVCAYSVSAATTLNTAGKTVNVCSVFDITTTGAGPYTITIPAPTLGAGSIVYINNMSASTAAITVGTTTINAGTSLMLVYNGTGWATSSNGSSITLQAAYNGSGGTLPQIQETSGGAGVEIADAATTNGTIFAVGSSAMASTYLGITNAAVTLNDALDFVAGSTGTIQVNQGGAGTTGSNLQVIAAAGNTSGAGGVLVLDGGAGGNAAAGGAVQINGGAAGGGNTAGGAVSVSGGAAAGTGIGGQVNVNGGAASTTGAGGSVVISGAAGGSAAANGAGSGGSITLQGGNATGGNNSGGSIILTAGAAYGTTGGGVAPGVVSIGSPVFTSGSETVTQTANNQSFTVAQSDLDTYGTIVVNVTGAYTGATVTMPSPTNGVAGRMVLVSAASGSVSFTLAATGMSSVNMAAGSTATLIWNGTNWSGTTTASSLQQVYNNTSTAPASIITTSTTKNILFQAGVGDDNANLFQVGNSLAAPVLHVDTTNTATGANLADNSGLETGGTSGWTAYVGTGSTASIALNTNPADLAAGAGSLDVNITATGTGGAGVDNDLNGTALSNTAGVIYNVSFNVLVSTATAPTLAVEYFKQAGDTSPDATCTVPSNGTPNNTAFFKYTCYFTNSGNTKATTNWLRIVQTNTAWTGHIYIDNLFIGAQGSSSALNSGELQVGGPLSQGLTLFQLDSFANDPVTGSVNQNMFGSMYYSTTLGRIQCYEADGWGSCGAAPNTNLILEPEYAGAVLDPGVGTDTHIGTMTADMCSDYLGLNPTEGTLCANPGDEYNYYRWTTSQVAAQTYSIFVKYQLPPTFGGFINSTTMQMVGRVSSTADASVDYVVYRDYGTGVSQCGTGTQQVTTTANTWQTVSYTAGDITTCGFQPGDIIMFRIDVSADNNAYAYAGRITFTMLGK